MVSPMQALQLARFPFLSASTELASKHGVDIESLMGSSLFTVARERGLQRVRDAIDRAEVSDIPLTGSEYDQLMEVMSYPYARMLVSAIDDRFLTKRYTLAESVRMNRLLGSEGHDFVVRLAAELGVNSTVSGDQLRMHFSDFLLFSSRIKSKDWKMVNNEMFDGFVLLPEKGFHRLLQNALQDKLERELPLNLPDEYRERMESDIKTIQNELATMKSRFHGGAGGEASIPDFPPCMRIMLANAQNGVNLPHSGRFALTSFLHNIGMSLEQILALFSESPDFDESKSIYQIKHITGEISGTEYTPPVCATMKSYGICYDPDALCQHEKVNHPLTYYRIKRSDQRRR